MNRSTIAILAFAASTGAASAGGFSTPVVEAAPAAPVYTAVTDSADSDWTGAYVGLQAGRQTGKFKLPAGSSSDANGTAFGVHGGYLQDMGSFVAGGELAYDKLKGFSLNGTDRDGQAIRAKAIAGYDAGKFLPYATLGYEQISFDKAGANGGDLKDSGIVYGAGVKFRATDNILLGAEVLRRDMKDFDDVKGQKLDGTTVGVNASFKF